MIKRFVSIFLIYAVFLLSCFPSLAQTPNRLSEKQALPPAAENNLEEIYYFLQLLLKENSGNFRQNN